MIIFKRFPWNVIIFLENQRKHKIFNKTHVLMNITDVKTNEKLNVNEKKSFGCIFRKIREYLTQF